MTRTVAVDSSPRTLGSVRGRIEPSPTLPDGQFRLRASDWEGDVVCTVAEDHHALLDGAWGRRAVVTGNVRRDPETDRPAELSDVTDIRILPDAAPGELLRSLAGIAPAPPGAEPPEVFIRRWRDAE
jgi:hypothetical protein